MKIIRNTTPLSDLYAQLKSNDLIINRTYQRHGGLWPDNARSYFIDTILNDFPFPKIIIRQTIDLKTKKTKREVIDGQQRLLTIKDFIENKIKLAKVSKNFYGSFFDDLPDDVQAKFLSYEISTDNVISATEEEILEIFRRINSYTLPLSKTEQRHATYQGDFKWFISELTEYFTPFLERNKILSIREISRMEDADLITEILQILIDGINSRSPSKLEKLYKDNDLDFRNKEEYYNKVISTLEFIKTNFHDLFETYRVPAYNFYSLFAALLFNKFGFPKNNNEIMVDINPIDEFCFNIDHSKEALFQILEEVETKDLTGKYNEFVEASIATTHSLKNRSIRVKELIEILRIR